MFSKITSRFFGSANDRQIKKYKPTIDIINKLEKNFESLSDNAREKLIKLAVDYGITKL